MELSDQERRSTSVVGAATTKSALQTLEPEPENQQLVSRSVLPIRDVPFGDLDGQYGDPLLPAAGHVEMMVLPAGVSSITVTNLLPPHLASLS